MTATVAQASYKQDDLVMVRHYGAEWQVGIVEKDTDGRWTRASTKSSPDSVSTMAPGYEADNIRPASFDDLYAAPDFVRRWIVGGITSGINPKIFYYAQTPAQKALQAAGVTRYKDLCERSDADLLKIKGVGRAAVAKFRSYQAAVDKVMPERLARHSEFMAHCVGRFDVDGLSPEEVAAGFIAGTLEDACPF